MYCFHRQQPGKGSRQKKKKTLKNIVKIIYIEKSSGT